VETIDLQLTAVERKWLPDLYENCRKLFADTYLPSHDESHHFRVWNFARQLVTELQKKDFSFNREKLENLHFAVFFHDTGMSVRSGSEHGRFSRTIAEDYLSTLDESIEGMDEVLMVIENHDKKDYHKRISETDIKPDSLFSLLNISDDLDAFGIIGIYRYAEIYMLRGITERALAIKVLENSKNRFQHFIGTYGFLEEFSRKQMIRYQILKKFYDDLILQQKTRNTSVRSGPSGVIKMINNHIVNEKLPLEKIFRKIPENSSDPYVLDFFKLLKKELNAYRL
jgi:HD superfamily phosphodiesterase